MSESSSEIFVADKYNIDDVSEGKFDPKNHKSVRDSYREG